MANNLRRVELALPPLDGRVPVQCGPGRIVGVTTPLDIIQAQEAVLEIGAGLGFAPKDVGAAVAAVSRMASALLTYTGEATMRAAPAENASGLEVEVLGGAVKCDSDRRRIAASVVRLLGHDEWTVPSDGGARVSARKTFRRRASA